MQASTPTRTPLLTHLALLALLLAPGAQANTLDHLQTSDDIGLNKVPHTGTSHVLVIYALANTDEIPPDEFARLSTLFRTEGGPGTFREFWQIQSRGAYDPIPYFVPPIVFRNSCPIPGKTAADCHINLNDFALLSTGAAKAAIAEVLRRVRDDNNLDLSFFDINGLEGHSDGFFDGVLLQTDMYVPTQRVLPGIALPLGAIGQAVTINSRPIPAQGGGPLAPLDGGSERSGVDGGTSEASVDGGLRGAAIDAGSVGTPLTLGITAFSPPATHEFGHNLGYIDLYGGPRVNGLMNTADVGLSAYSRLQIGWGEAIDVTQAGDIELAPVLESGQVLRFGSPPNYVLVENRSGPKHIRTDNSVPGLYFYSVDERALPHGALGFLDLNTSLGSLYLPNQDPPYLNISLPVECQFYSLQEQDSCTLVGQGARRDVQDQAGTHYGFYIEQGPTAADGTITVLVRPGTVAEAIAAESADAGTVDAGTSVVLADAGPSVSSGGCAGCEQSRAAPGDVSLGAVMVLLWFQRRQKNGVRR